MRALWSAAWTVGAVAYFAAGSGSSPEVIGVMVAAVLLGLAVGSLRRWHQPVMGAWAATFSLVMLAVIAWMQAMETLLIVATLAAVVASLGFIAGAPPTEAVAPTRALRVVTPAVRGLALGALAVGAGAASSLHVGLVFTAAALCTLGWAVLMTRAPVARASRWSGGIAPRELFQGALITLGLGSWLLLALVVSPQFRFDVPWVPVHDGAFAVGVVLGTVMLGVGFGLAIAVPFVDTGTRSRAFWILVPAIAGILMLMPARPGLLLWLGVAGVLLVAMAVGAGFRACTALVSGRAVGSTIRVRTPAPAMLAVAAAGALASGILVRVVEDRDLLLLPVLALALAACWIDVPGSASRGRP